MMTRRLVPVLVALLVGAASCKADRSKPRIGAADASVAAAPAPAPAPAEPPAPSTVGGDAGTAPATRDPEPGAGKEAAGGSEPAEPAEPKGQPPADDEDRPENLKVLPKTMTTDQVTDYMSKQVGRGLGVKCGHCHEGGDFAADGNPHKKKARAMIRMTAELNQRFFAGKREITCFTCHLGHEKPGGK